MSPCRRTRCVRQRHQRSGVSGSFLDLRHLPPLAYQGRRTIGRIEIGSTVTISVHTTTLRVIEPSFPQRLEPLLKRIGQTPTRHGSRRVEDLCTSCCGNRANRSGLREIAATRGAAPTRPAVQAARSNSTSAQYPSHQCAFRWAGTMSGHGISHPMANAMLRLAGSIPFHASVSKNAGATSDIRGCSARPFSTTLPYREDHAYQALLRRRGVRAS
jgi:hypothetical protein